MAILPIRIFGDPALRQRATAVKTVDANIRKLVRDMTDTMQAAGGAGLAAPQIGIVQRVIVWSHENEQGSLVNPSILEAYGKVEGEERCLSLPALVFPVLRAKRVVVTGLDDCGRQVEIRAEDRLARILQHEIDHLDGVLAIDYLSPDRRQEAIRQLLEVLTVQQLEPMPAN